MAIRTMDRLRSLIRNKGMFLGINQTVYADNFKSIPEVKKIAAEFGAEYLGFVGLKNRPLFSDSGDCDFSLVDLDREARDFVVEELGNCRRKHVFSGGLSNCLETLIIGHYVRGQLDLLRNRLIRHRCMNLFTHFRLNPNGDIMTCSYDTEVLGNIRLDSYSGIMAKQTTKKKLRKVKSCGKCWLGCEVSPSWVSSLCLG
jgi:MoaA/NifB/PqqE/SkfB family radical SAM enzyme